MGNLRKERRSLIKRLDNLVREIIYKRDDYTCQKCWSKTNRLNPAHFVGRRNMAVRWDKDNIVTFCVGCHFYMDGNPYDFTEWYKNWIGYEMFKKLMIKKFNKLKTSLPNLKLVELMLKQELKKGYLRNIKLVLKK